MLQTGSDEVHVIKGKSEGRQQKMSDETNLQQANPDTSSEVISTEEVPEALRKNIPQGATVRRIKKKKKPVSETARQIQQESKDRRDMVLLKQERQGMEIKEGILPEKSDDEVIGAPTTMEGKVENFWYHNKIKVGVLSFVALLLIIGCIGWFFPKPCDVKIMLATEYPLDDPDIDIEPPFAKYTEDYDENGKLTVGIEVLQVVRTPGVVASNNYENIINQFKIALAMGDYEPALYILDEANYQYMANEIGVTFRDLSDLDASGNIKGDRVALSDTPLAEDFPDFEQLFKELYICIYDTEQMKTDSDGNPEDKFLGKEKYVKMYNESLEYLTHLLNGETFSIPEK